MNKVVRLTESELVRLVKKIISEESTKNICDDVEKILSQYHDFGNFYAGETKGAGYVSFTLSGKHEGYSPGFGMFVNNFGNERNGYKMSIELSEGGGVPFNEIKQLYKTTFSGLGKQDSNGFINFSCKDVRKFLELFKQFERDLLKKYKLKLTR